MGRSEKRGQYAHAEIPIKKRERKENTEEGKRRRKMIKRKGLKPPSDFSSLLPEQFSMIHKSASTNDKESTRIRATSKTPCEDRERGTEVGGQWRLREEAGRRDRRSATGRRRNSLEVARGLRRREMKPDKHTAVDRGTPRRTQMRDALDEGDRRSRRERKRPYRDTAILDIGFSLSLSLS